LQGGVPRATVGVDINPFASSPGKECDRIDINFDGNSTIGGNVFLMHSVPPNSLVYCEEAQVRVVAKGSKADHADYSI
jgi:hypothetical protein